jgi:hypothetical protein
LLGPPLFEGKTIDIVLSGENKQKVTITVFQNEINIQKSYTEKVVETKSWKIKQYLHSTSAHSTQTDYMPQITLVRPQ